MFRARWQAPLGLALAVAGPDLRPIHRPSPPELAVVDRRQPVDRLPMPRMTKTASAASNTSLDNQQPYTSLPRRRPGVRPWSCRAAIARR